MTDDKPARKTKSSGWQTVVRAFSTVIRRIIKRNPRCRAEIVARLQCLTDELNDVNDQAAA